MCNLYSITRSQEAMRRLFAVAEDLTGNLPPMPGVFPDMLAPVVRGADGERRLELMRWGMPGPPQFGGAPVTNIRNTKSAHWRRWLGPESRCLVPANSFCEWADTKPRKTPTWFALGNGRPLFAFAGIWTTWHGTRGPKSAPFEGEHRLFGFLTTQANGIIGPIHPKAMPVLLTSAGFTLPIHGIRGNEACVSLSGRHPALNDATKPALHLVAMYAYEQARRLAPAPSQSDARASPLTSREREVLTWAAVGKSYMEIADLLRITERTVTAHSINATVKLGAANKTQAVVKALQSGYIRL